MATTSYKARVKIVNAISAKVKIPNRIVAKVKARFPVSAVGGAGEINVYLFGELIETISSPNLNAESINIIF